MQPFFLVFVYTCGLMAACTIVYGYAQLYIAQKLLRSCVLGFAFGGSGVLAMLQSIEIEPGLFADARGAFVGMAMVFGGPVASVIAVALTVVVRLMISGAGSLLGIMVIISTAGCAGIWLRVFKNPVKQNRRAWVMLTLACAGPTFVALHSLPGDHLRIGIFMVAVTAIVVWAFGKLLHAEQTRGKREQQLAQAALTDMLTGLPNRRAFDEHVRLLEETGADDIMLLLLDVDHFKSINDDLGHDTGDMVLQGIAQAIRNTIREKDFAARIGGEEFAVVVRSCDTNSAQQIAERFRMGVQVPYGPEADRRTSTISVGGFYVGGEPFRYDGGLKKADEALYHSKRAGRNRATVAAPIRAALAHA